MSRTPLPLGLCLELAVRALTRNRLQTTLAMLGMTVGVGAVVTSMALGHGAQQAINDQLRAAGANVILVTAGNYKVKGEDVVVPEGREEAPAVADLMEALKRSVEAVRAGKDPRELREARLPRQQSGRRREPCELENFFPAIDPVVVEQGAGGIAPPDLRGSRRIGSQTLEHFDGVGTVGVEGENDVFPIEKHAECIAHRSLADHHGASGCSFIVPEPDLYLSSRPLLGARLGRGDSEHVI